LVRREAWSARDGAMRNEPEPHEESSAMNRRDVLAALWVSLLSVIWTVLSSALAVAIGLGSHQIVLVAFGAVGVVDAVGSVALTFHFRHALRHDQLSERFERVAHRVVLAGLVSVGSAAVAIGVIRLATSHGGGSSDAGVVLAGVSFVLLLVLSSQKQRIARRVESSALRSDGHLSGVGATFAAITLAGTGLERWWGWHWSDAVATMILGVIAVWLAVTTWLSERSSKS
jgi:divalent metal cation (Fe/Co/Zn/Cd) transporter